MLGTIVNSIAILIGGSIGLLIKGNIKEKYKTIIMQALGLSVLFLGLSKAVENLPRANSLLFILSLIIGGIIGEYFDIEAQIEALGLYAERKFSKSKNSNISKGFVVSSILFCVGTMAILGSFESGINNDHRTLYTKSTLDGITSVIFASTFGVGVLLSSVSVLVYQGVLTVFSGFLKPYLSEAVLVEISLLGGILIFCLGLNMLNIIKIKVANFLPAVLIPPIYFLVLNFIVARS